MDNKDFDKFLKGKLNEITEDDFQFQPSSWDRFKAQKEEQAASPPIPLRDSGFIFIPSWFKKNGMVAAVGLLLLSNIFFAHKIIKTQDRVMQMTLTVTNLEKEVVTYRDQILNLKQINEAIGKNTTNQSNTTFDKGDESGVKTIVIQRPRGLNVPMAYLSKSIHLPRNFEGSLNNFGNMALYNNGNFGAVTSANTPTSANQLIAIDSIQKSNNQLVESKNSKQQSPFDLLQLKKLTLKGDFTADASWWNIPKNNANQDYLKEIPFSTKLALFVEDIKPTHYALGIQASFGELILQNADVLAYTYGIEGSATFFNRFELSTGFNLWGQQFQLGNTFYNDLGKAFVNLELPTPNNSNDALTDAHGNINGYEVPLTARFLINQNNNFSPFLGVGITGQFYSNYELEGYYTDATGSTYENKTENTLSGFSLGLIRGHAGFKYTLSDNFKLRFEGTYGRTLRPQAFGLLSFDQLAFQLGLFYGF